MPKLGFLKELSLEDLKDSDPGAFNNLFSFFHRLDEKEFPEAIKATKEKYGALLVLGNVYKKIKKKGSKKLLKEAEKMILTMSSLKHSVAQGRPQEVTSPRLGKFKDATSPTTAIENTTSRIFELVRAGKISFINVHTRISFDEERNAISDKISSQPIFRVADEFKRGNTGYQDVLQYGASDNKPLSAVSDYMRRKFQRVIGVVLFSYFRQVPEEIKEGGFLGLGVKTRVVTKSVEDPDKAVLALTLPTNRKDDFGRDGMLWEVLIVGDKKNLEELHANLKNVADVVRLMAELIPGLKEIEKLETQPTNIDPSTKFVSSSYPSLFS